MLKSKFKKTAAGATLLAAAGITSMGHAGTILGTQLAGDRLRAYDTSPTVTVPDHPVGGLPAQRARKESIEGGTLMHSFVRRAVNSIKLMPLNQAVR